MVVGKLNIYSSDGFVLRSNMGYFIRDTMKTSRVLPVSQDPAVYIPQYIATSRANNNCLVGDNVTMNPPIKKAGILRSRKNSAGDGPTKPNYSVSENREGGESQKQALVRGVKEELGSLIHEDFFHQDGPNFYVIIEAAAKNRLLNNYQRLIPITEIYDVRWEASPLPYPVNIVKDTDIYEYNLISIIDAAYAAPALPLALNIQDGGQTFLAAELNYGDANHLLGVRPAPIAPRQIGVPPPPPAPAPPPPPAPAPPPRNTRPARNLEEARAYLERKVAENPGVESHKYRLEGLNRDNDRWRNIQIEGGKRRITRRKKLKQPKKRGTSKRGVRRSH